MLDLDAILASQELSNLYVMDKISREASCCQLKCLVGQLETALAEGRTFEIFRLPPDVDVRPAGPTELRVIADGGDVQMQDKHTGEAVTVCPADLLAREFNVLTCVNDRGPTVATPLWFIASEYLCWPFLAFSTHSGTLSRWPLGKAVPEQRGGPLSSC